MMLRKAMPSTLGVFESGVQHYFSQAFSLAQATFEKVLQQNPADKTAQLFLTKIKWLAEAGVAEDWTGVEMMEKQ